MSFERASKSCQACHAYSKDLAEVRNQSVTAIGELAVAYATRESGYIQARDTATKEALKALEVVRASAPEGRPYCWLIDSADSRPKSSTKVAEQMLRTCQGCDYSEPKIADLLKEPEEAKKA